jgi:Fe-S-cluster-containing dehydrogenase component
MKGDKIMPQYKMKIDLSKCVGCGTCGIACKLGNNTPKRQNGQTFNRADFITETTGAFPNTKWTALPVNCNHCDNPKCVAACPVAPVTDVNCEGGKRKAMYKLNAANGGIVLHDDDRCIGCRLCQRACPYSTANVGAARAQFSVISYNQNLSEPYGYLTNSQQAVLDCTASESEIRDAASMTDIAPAYRNSWSYTPVTGVPVNDLRTPGNVEKCYFCIHRLNDSTLGATENVGERRPYCVIACPTLARELIIDGSAITGGPKVLAKKAYTYLRKVVLTTKSSRGSSRPNVFYVGKFSKR